MKLYRLVKKKYASDFSGEGARLYGGRWNLKGTAMIYTSESRALALVEVLANSSVGDLTVNLFSSVEIILPDGIRTEQISISDLPNDWASYPSPYRIAQMGSDWVTKKKTVALKIPSSVIHNEFNVLLNPHHPDYKKMKFTITDFDLDERLINS